MSYVKSPITKKAIKVGGFAHKNLVKKGYFQESELSPKKEIMEKEIMEKEIMPTPTYPEDTHELVKQTSKNAMNVMRKIKKGEIELPDDLDDDEKLSNYIQQCLLLEMIKKDKPGKQAERPAKKKKPKPPPPSSEECTESESE
jgi:hypothetical protein